MQLSYEMTGTHYMLCTADIYKLVLNSSLLGMLYVKVEVSKLKNKQFRAGKGLFNKQTKLGVCKITVYNFTRFWWVLMKIIARSCQYRESGHIETEQNYKQDVFINIFHTQLATHNKKHLTISYIVYTNRDIR